MRITLLTGLFPLWALLGSLLAWLIPAEVFFCDCRPARRSVQHLA